MAYKYAYPGPPFNFLGHFSETQWNAFQQWQKSAAENLSDIELHHRIRAQQLRKSAGVLEEFYTSESLAPTFAKQPWAPGPFGHFNYSWRDDHLPMIAMSAFKDYLREQLEKQDEAVFSMNHVRYLIEKTEDRAQKAEDAPTAIAELLNKINGYFAEPRYQAVLVKDQTDLYAGEPRFRVSQFDAPTRSELEQVARAAPSDTIQLKEPTT